MARKKPDAAEPASLTEVEKRKRCFVISPIGLDRSDVREHADDVFEFVIEPALKECGFKAYRSDHLQQPGKISEQMFRAMLTDDLCVAVLTGRNPNVFYELAIAQSARRPVILLLHKGEEPPFDIKDLRLVFYDLKPRPLRDGIYVKEIVAHIRNLEANKWNVPNLFGEPLPPASPASSTGIMYERSTQYGSQEDWMNLLRATENHFDILGISLRYWRSAKNFTNVVREKAAAGCMVRMLLMHPESSVLPHLINSDLPDDQVRGIITDAKDMHEYFSGEFRNNANVKVRQMSVGCPHYSICRTDESLTYLLYLYSENTKYSPLWQVPVGSFLYEIMVQEFESLWMANGDKSSSSG